MEGEHLLSGCLPETACVCEASFCALSTQLRERWSGGAVGSFPGPSGFPLRVVWAREALWAFPGLPSQVAESLRRFTKTFFLSTNFCCISVSFIEA